MLSPMEHRTVGAAHKVLVSNVSPGATDVTLREFFAFAGSVGEVELSSDVAGATQHGYVTFLSAQGAETAILLDGAMIVDRPLSIHAPADEAKPEHEPVAHGAESTTESGLPGAMPDAAGASVSGGSSGGGTTYELPGAGLPAGSEEASSAIAALLAAGYTLGKRAIDFLADFEERHGKPAASAMRVLLDLKQQARSKAAELDETHAISANLKKFDEEHEISERASVLAGVAADQAAIAAETVREGAAQLSARLHEKARADPNVQSAWDTVASGWASVNAFATSTWREAVSRTSDAPAADVAGAAGGGAAGGYGSSAPARPPVRVNGGSYVQGPGRDGEL